MKTILTEEIILQLGFKEVPNIIQKNYQLVLKDKVYPCSSDLGLEDDLHFFKAISLAVCNDKRKGEYYLYLREGDSPARHEDDLVCITRELLYKEDLEDFIRVCTLTVNQHE